MEQQKYDGFFDSELTEQEKQNALFTVIPVPLEQTVSYGAGTCDGPAAILAASQQLERWDGCSEPVEAGISTTAPVDCSGSAETVLAAIEAKVAAVVETAVGGDTGNSLPVLLGGEHTVSLGAIRVLSRKLADQGRKLGIIQLDAHADLRESYEGSIYSHACVMRRSVEECGCELFQFGIRALCRDEVEYRKERNIASLDGRVIPTTDLAAFTLPEDFPEDIYLTLDVDGLDPSVIGATGTPVPGGPGWYQTLTFFERAIAGRRVVGFDVVELAPRTGDHGSDFAAAQLVYSVMGLIVRNREGSSK